MIVILQLFRLVLVLVAWVAMLYDNYHHRDLKLVCYAYTFLVLSAVAAIFASMASQAQNPIVVVFDYLTHIFGILLAGLLFLLTAYAAHQQMNAVEEKTKQIFGVKK